MKRFEEIIETMVILIGFWLIWHGFNDKSVHPHQIKTGVGNILWQTIETTNPIYFRYQGGTNFDYPFTVEKITENITITTGRYW